MLKLYLIILGAAVAIGGFPSLQAFDENPMEKGDTVEPYAVLTEGIKLRFDQVDKQYLGRKCSVYMKRGKWGITGSGIPGKNQYVFKGQDVIENGELVGFSKHSVDVVWFFAGGGAHGGATSDEMIDYIIVEKK